VSVSVALPLRVVNGLLATVNEGTRLLWVDPRPLASIHALILARRLNNRSVLSLNRTEESLFLFCEVQRPGGYVFVQMSEAAGPGYGQHMVTLTQRPG
jgi:hypothetical protein